MSQPATAEQPRGSAPSRPRRLSIVVPALDEEEAVGATLERCVAARAHIIESSPVSEVEVVLVNDGSSDHTEQIALGFDEVTVLGFDANQGYGAAIRCGFEHSTGDLLGFIDADGTCDPLFFAELCSELETAQADIALGARLGKDSEMPLVRTIGNTMFAWLLGMLSKTSVSDIASGMRVIRRDALQHLDPLPDGLHYTPAMTARALLDDKLSIVEVPMSYSERIGGSKLSVVKDGFRFLGSVIRAAVCFRPSRPLQLTALMFGLLAVLIGFSPVLMWFTDGRIEEWMVYRILMSSLLASVAGLLMCAAVISEILAAAAHRRELAKQGMTGLLVRLSRPLPRWTAVTLLVGLGVVIVWPGIITYVTRGEVTMHWSRPVLASLLVMLAAMVVITGFFTTMAEQIRVVRSGTPPVSVPDRVRRAQG